MNLQLVPRNRQMNSGVPKVSLAPKGTIYLSNQALKKMQVKTAKKFFVYQDQDNKQKWFLTPHEDGYISLGYKDESQNKGGQAYLKDIVIKIINSYYHEGKGALKFTVGDPINNQGQTFYPLELITESLEMNIPDPNGR